MPSLKPFLLLVLLTTLSSSQLIAQLSHKVLFLGNSYTGVNNLPQLVHDVALSAGDTLVFDSYTPGGYQLITHYQDATSQSKIMASGWDYVVLQGQSQEPITQNGTFAAGASNLYNQIKQSNPCAVPLLYMTWGRKNGDANNCPFFPVMCTYQGMDTSLRNAYLNVTEALNGEVAPVSVVWSYLRQNFPAIDLYQADESHPSAAGSYAAACCFYASIFKKDPTLITFNFGLNAIDAANIRTAAKLMVLDNLQQWNFKQMPTSGFTYQIGAGTNEVFFYPITLGVQQTYLWDFGDGTTSTALYPNHSYANDGTYTITLTTTTCHLQNLNTSITDTTIQFCSHTPTVSTINPWLCGYDTLWTEPADAYQWYAYGSPIPVTTQYLPNYALYGISGFSVISSINSCAELSGELVLSNPWSGYYFDALGDPCAGDTVQFAVLHINGFLFGLENILWYKNDTLLTSMINEDTLAISSSGKYECKVVDPTSNCPLDTTSYQIIYNCNVTGIEVRDRNVNFTLFPNPAAESISVQFMQAPNRETIQIYNSLGRLVKSINTSNSTTKINIANLPNGLYILRLKSHPGNALRFIKN
jgi:PKD repeat protein